MTTKSLHFKWTVSRGRDTYGYNICTLLVDGEKVGKCMGGGYDMQGTSFAEWLQSSYQTELKAYADKLVPENYNGTRIQFKGVYGIYGLNGESDIILDGGCGFDSMKKIAEAIGIKLQWNKESDKYKNHTFYTAIIQ